jgi:thiol-disulfide isomerase/thioredoxin
MKRASTILLALGAAVFLLIGLVTLVRARHIMAANHGASSHSLAMPAKSARDSGDEADDTPAVIHFARNPERMPPFLVNDLQGTMVSTADLHGKVVVLNFWATWCPPCREEIPEMIELSKRYKDKLQIIGVSMDDAPAREVAEFAMQVGINYPVVMGSGSIEAEYGGVPALPTSFIISPEGRVVQKHAGLYPIEVYDTEIRSLLGMPVKAKVETFQDVGQIFLKNAANATELPGVDLKGLTPAQKRAALKRMNSELCSCGCKYTIAQCRINDSACPTSKGLAAKIVREIVSGHPAPTAVVAN